MDTRNKILTSEQAALLAPEWRRRGPLAVACGTFDVLLAAHVRELRRVFEGYPTRVVVLASPAAPALPERARAELLAALDCVDFVVPAGDRGPDAVLAALPAATVARLEAGDQLRFRALVEHVHARHAG